MNFQSLFRVIGQRTGALKKSPARGLRTLSGCGLLFALAQGAPAAPDTAPIDPRLSGDEISQLTKEAFFWGMQQAGFYELRYQFTQNEANPAFRGINKVQHNSRLFTAKERFATTPNASTLYSGGSFDLSREPIIVTAGAVRDGRYWSIQAADQYAHWFFFVGSPFTGNDAQQYLIVGPDWKGVFPPSFSAGAATAGQGRLPDFPAHGGDWRSDQKHDAAGLPAIDQPRHQRRLDDQAQGFTQGSTNAATPAGAGLARGLSVRSGAGDAGAERGHRARLHGGPH